MRFNKEQQEAIDSINGLVQVISCAGSGKTTTLIERVNQMCLSGIPQPEILVISFTNASAKELKNKLANNGLENVTVGTFHSICRSLLEDCGYDDLMKQPNKYQIKRLIEDELGLKNINMNEILSWISYQKNYGHDANSDLFEKKDTNYSLYELRRCFSLYESYKKYTGTYDFDDWLIETVTNYKNNTCKRTWKYLCLDESQDSNSIQYKLINFWCPKKNIFLVGDKNQSLYRFRGAVPELFEAYPEVNNGTKVINMNTNYRSCRNIVENANNFIRPYNDGYKYYKDAVAFNERDGKIVPLMVENKEDEARYVVSNIKRLLSQGKKPSDIAIIYRNNSMPDYVENMLKANDIDYKLYSDNSFFDRKEVKGIVSILRLVNDFTDDEAFEYIFSTLRCNPIKYYKNSLLDELKIESGKRNYSLYEAFIDYRFKLDWQRRNQQMFIDFIDRLRIQKEKKLSPAKIMENIFKIFRIDEMIKENYEYSTWEDKYDSIQNLYDMGKGTTVEAFIRFTEMKPVKKSSDSNCISLMTIHASKGLEFDTVFVIGLQDGKFPSPLSSIEDEARIFYVAVTRAKENLYITSIDESQFYQEYVG